jgi:tetratricopeptide (TPR) repeat protein
MPAYDVFLSFSGTELARVEEIHRQLCKRGHRVFLDRRAVRPGESISAEVEDGLRNSRLLVVNYSRRYAIRHACQFELLHAFVAAETENRPERILAINPEDDREHIAPVELRDRRLILDDGSDASCATIVKRIGEALTSLPGTFQGIDFHARPRSYGGTPTVEPRVRRYGAMWGLRSALNRADFPVTQRPGSRTAVLAGLSGAGKTKLVDDFVLHFGHTYRAVYRLDLGGLADTYPDEVARVLDLDRRQRPRIVLNRAEDVLAARAGSGRLLWVVDSLPADLPVSAARELVCDVAGVDTVLVTRGHVMPELGRGIVLSGLTEDEALELVSRLYRWSDQEEEELAHALAAGVSRHPMALAELAKGAAERHGLATFTEHVGRVLDGSSDLMTQVASVFVDRLRREDDEDRLTLLRFAGVCGPDAVPVRFVHQVLGGFGVDEQRTLDAMRGLRDAHLSTWDDGRWTVHAVIRDAARQLPIGAPSPEQLAQAAARYLAHGDTPLAPDLISLARHLCARTGLPGGVRERLVRRVAVTSLSARSPVLAARYFDLLLDEFPDQAPAVVVAAARSHLQSGEYERAARYAREAGASLNALLVHAAALDANGEFAESDPVWEKVISHPDHVNAPFADDVAVRLQWIRGRRLRGSSRAHRTYLRDALDRADELPPLVLNQVRLELAQIEMLTDGQKIARTLAQQVIDHFERIDAAHDPLATEARFVLANADLTLGLLELRPDRGQWPKAEARLRALQAKQEKELGVRNISTLTTRTAVGWALISQGKPHAARDHAKELMGVLAGRTGVDHLLYFRCHFVLGMAYGQLSKFDRSVEQLDQAHRGQLSTLGEAHPETLRTQFELAMALKLGDSPDQARINALLDRARSLSAEVTGRLNDLYGLPTVGAMVARLAPGPLLRWAHHLNHGHKQQSDG